MERKFKFFVLVLGLFLITRLVWAAEENAPQDLQVIDTTSPAKLVKAESMPNNSYEDPVKYTLGPDDIIEVSVLRHPEFSGVFPINKEGKIQYKYAGDIEVNGLNKKELEKRIQQIIANYVIGPEVNVTILEYKSKVIYVLGEVGQPGKYYMMSESIPVREAVVQAGLPTLSAAMRRCQLITPDIKGKPKIQYVDLYSILYGGKLNKNIDMHPGDVLHVPATVMAKIIRVISPVTNTVGTVASGPSSAETGRTSTRSLMAK